jgi:tetratricopeptide (TPR) repeat protein
LIIFLVIGNFNLMNLNLPAEVSLSRGASWNITKSALAENPFFGSGPGTFYYDFSKFRSESFNSSPLWNVRFDSASGILFEVLSTVGVLGALSLVILVLIGLSVSFLSLVRNANREADSVLLGLFASFVTILLFGLLFSFNNSMILLGFILAVLTVSVGLVMYPEKFTVLNLSFRASAKYALALAAIFLFVSAGVVVLFTMGLKMYMADVYARDAMLANNLNEKISHLNRSIQLADYQDIYYLNVANHYMALANQAAVRGDDQTAITSNLSRAIDSGKQAVDINPNKASNRESLALIYENASFYTRGALEWAEQHYEKVIELDPMNPTPYLRIALVNMARANAEQSEGEKEFFVNEAITKYDEAIDKKSDLAAAHYGKAIANEKLNNIDNAIEDMKKARLSAQNNIDYLFELGRLYFNRGVSALSLGQQASQQIAERDISPEEDTGTTTTELSVQPTEESTTEETPRNKDITAAEQIFLSIVSNNSNHANARYSLAVLYQKIGSEDKARSQVQKLLSIIQDKQTRQAVEQQFSDIL